jgi:hypothetical protein
MKMNCPRCQGSVPDRASFCPQCGNDVRVFRASLAGRAASAVPLAVNTQTAPQSSRQNEGKSAGFVSPPPSQTAMNPQVVAVPNTQKKTPWALILGTLLAICLFSMGFLAFKLFQKTGKDDPTSILARTERAPAPVLQQTAKSEPVLGKQAQAPKQMPENIRKWLEHLEKIEKLRGKLAQKGLAEFMVMAPSLQQGADIEALKALASGDPNAEMPKSAADKVADTSSDSKVAWADLRREFDSFPPPPECKSIADSYGHALDETGAMIQDILDAVQVAKDDPQKALQTLYGMKNSSKSIDEYGNAADDKVKEICDFYDTRKWFSINSDFGGSSIFGSLGLR